MLEIAPFFGACLNKLSKEVDKFANKESEILDYFKSNKLNQFKVSEYSAISAIPLYVIYYFIQKSINPAYKPDMERLCKFYQIENDLC